MKIIHVYCREFKRKRQLLEKMWRSILKANILMNKTESHTILAQLLSYAFKAEIQIVGPYAVNLCQQIDTSH